ncbi:MAG: hypothetical protein LBH04_03850 [Tannerellaceae bacterium]|jgi:hypothetical protein|nr:hypothetical protein [Tannerellaceae bacterium]
MKQTRRSNTPPPQLTKQSLKRIKTAALEAIRWFVPFGLVEKRRQKIRRANLLKSEAKEAAIKEYFSALNRENASSEIIEIADYLKNHPFSIYPYEFTRKYNANDIEVFHDYSCQMSYVLHNRKKLYFPSEWSRQAVREYYNGLCLEQDEKSPHRYETPDFCVTKGDIIADVGAAEGIWALNYADIAGKIYLFECEKHWIAALKKTFEPWKDKVRIVNKYVSNTTNLGNITMDDFFNNKPVNFIKADIEGAEPNLLDGCKSLLARSITSNTDLKLLLCAYHNQGDEEKITECLHAKGFITEHSTGYMLYIIDSQLNPPYIRRGLIRATKAQGVHQS